MKRTMFAGWAAVLGLVISSSGMAQNAGVPRSYQLSAKDNSFWKLIPHHASLKTMGNGFGFTEGPVWDEAGYVWVSDEEINKIFRLYPDGHREEMIALGDPDGNTYDREHRLLDCASVLRAIIRLTPNGRSYTVLADRYDGKRFNSPNDVVVGPDGAIYFTDPTLDLPKGAEQEIPFQGVYRLDPSGKVTLLTKELSQPNGLAFTPDGKQLFIDDSDKRTIWVYNFHPDGTVSDGRVFGREDGVEGEGVPDGMRFDKVGNLFVTGPRGIWIWNRAGVHIGTIELPEQPANLAWGGKNHDTLYITATKSVYILPTLTRGFVPYE